MNETNHNAGVNSATEPKEPPPKNVPNVPEQLSVARITNSEFISKGLLGSWINITLSKSESYKHHHLTSDICNLFHGHCIHAPALEVN